MRQARRSGPCARGVAAAALGVLALALVACGGTGGGAPRAGATASGSTVAPSAGPTSSPDAPTLVDIGGGVQVFVHCAGTGSPTVIFESGDESDQFQWSGVFRSVAAQTRACAYDRLGNGSSDAATGCRRTPQLLAVLQGMLTAVEAKPPYVVVGTSGGGFLMTSFAYAHPEQVAGIVLAETPHAIIPSQAPKQLLADIDCHATNNVERRDYVAVERYAWTHRHRIGRIPMTVITNDYGKNWTNQEERTNVKGQQGWLVLSPLARQVVVTSGHDVPENEPDLTSKEILRVLAAARA